MKTCCFTGHRHIPTRHLSQLPAALETEILSLLENGVTTFRNGGAIGFDTVAALKVIALRQTHPEMRLELWLPCHDQDKHWSSDQRDTYAYILSQADHVHYISDIYTRFCMLERDRRMVDGSDVCVAYCLRTEGGTGYTCQYALKNGVPIHNLAQKISR